MKFLVFLTCFVAAVYAAGPTREEFRSDLKKAQVSCLKKVGIDRAFVIKSLDQKTPDVLKAKSYFLCIANVMEALDNKGKINAETIGTTLNSLIKDPEAIKAGATKCAVQKDTGEETAYHLTPCFLQFLVEQGIITKEERA